MEKYEKKDTGQLFLLAVRKIEDAAACRKKKQYIELLDSLRESATLLAHAIQSANSKRTESSEIEKTQAVQNSPVFNKLSQQSQTIIQVLISPDFHLGDQNNKFRDAVTDLFDRYNAALIDARRVLLSELKEKEKAANKVPGTALNPATKKAISYLFFPLLILFALAIFSYIRIEPVHNSNLAGEIYWQTKENEAFSAAYTQIFDVTEGLDFKDYFIDMELPVKITKLRIDPVHRKDLAEIEIKWIKLVGKNEQLLKMFSADELNLWSCANCLKINRNNGKNFTIKVVDNDPFIISPELGVKEVTGVAIRMKIISKKSFLEWLLGIDT